MTLLGALSALPACGDGSASAWAGSVDTLASGQVVVRNPAAPVWSETETWTLTEELRIGSLDEEGPTLFGEISALDADDDGRIYVLEGQAQEIRVFDRDGAHLRTFGRKGGGPGELAGALHVEVGPDGDLWVVDPQNNRVSVFAPDGRFLEGHPVPGGFWIRPWPGRFDRAGRYYYPIPRIADGDFSIALAEYDSAMQAVDTLAIPEDPVERDYFELNDPGGRILRAGIPFGPGFQWALSPAGTFWGLLTGEYRMVELSRAGDTLRSVTREFEPIPVSDADLDQAREDLEWFTEQGGQVDWSKLPSEKPPVDEITVDRLGYLWVWINPPAGPAGSEFDVFSPEGLYLGRVTSPVRLVDNPTPVIGDGSIHAVTESELEVPYVVRLAITKPGASREP